MSNTWQKQKQIYEKCSHLEKTKPDYLVDESILREIGSNYRTIPTFELSLFKQVFVKHYSMLRNERLCCRWKQYRENMEKRVAIPLQVPNANDLVFRNCAIRFAPNENNRYLLDNRRKLKPGPGVDRCGQMPIPQELLMKRSGKIDNVDKGQQRKSNNSKNQTEK